MITPYGFNISFGVWQLLWRLWLWENSFWICVWELQMQCGLVITRSNFMKMLKSRHPWLHEGHQEIWNVNSPWGWRGIVVTSARPSVCPPVRPSVRPFPRDISRNIFQIFPKLYLNILWINISDKFDDGYRSLSNMRIIDQKWLAFLHSCVWSHFIS